MEPSQLFLSLFMSVVGTAYFVYGKKKPSMPFLGCGVVLMFFGYFVDNFWITTMFFALFTAVPFFIH
jgi:hypothetical protein